MHAPGDYIALAGVEPGPAPAGGFRFAVKDNIDVAGMPTTAGGSSGGSAAAVARGDADVALSTDTGGSVSIPAAFCGIAGLRPTTGRYPAEGVVRLSTTRDTVGTSGPTPPAASWARCTPPRSSGSTR